MSNPHTGLSPNQENALSQVSDGKSFERRAPLHPHTGLPLGNGCRWERSVLDQLEFPVYVFFMP